MKAIEVRELSKDFFVRKGGLSSLQKCSYPTIWKSLKACFTTKKEPFHAIRECTFSVEQGERVAFIGPNGAGKSTTIKILTGILAPTSGLVKVVGLVPWQDRTSLGYKIGTVFGQRSQLWYHLPPEDTFYLLSKIYEIPEGLYRKRVDELVALFEIEPFLKRPVRQLSLGERMRCELVASLLHGPSVLFLDEPTIGLDINAKLKIRSLLNRLSREFGTTLFLTSHDTADIEQVSDRVLVLDKGSLISDSSLEALKQRYVKRKILNLVTDCPSLSINLPGIEIKRNSDFRLMCEVNLQKTSIEEVIHQVLLRTTLKDVTIEDPSMEEIIRELYSELR